MSISQYFPPVTQAFLHCLHSLINNPGFQAFVLEFPLKVPKKLSYEERKSQRDNDFTFSKYLPVSHAAPAVLNVSVDFSVEQHLKTKIWNQ